MKRRQFFYYPLLNLITILFAALFFSLSLHAADRVALVIENGAYEKANQLPNATRDAAAVAQLLEGQGFMVIHVPDASVEAMYEGLENLKRESIDRFDNKVNQIIFSDPIPEVGW